MSGADRIAIAFADSGKRAALMPYLMGGFPDMEASKAIGFAYADGGADLVELGIPFSDPLADGPVIQAAGTAALKAGSTTAAVLGVCEALAQRLPVVVMCYANHVYARGVEAFASALAAAGASGVQLTDQATGLLRQQRWSEAEAVARQAVAALKGSGQLYEAYAEYDLGRALAEQSKCGEAIQHLNRSEAIQGHRSQIDDARSKCQ